MFMSMALLPTFRFYGLSLRSIRSIILLATEGRSVQKGPGLISHGAICVSDGGHWLDRHSDGRTYLGRFISSEVEFRLARGGFWTTLVLFLLSYSWLLIDWIVGPSKV